MVLRNFKITFLILLIGAFLSLLSACSTSSREPAKQEVTFIDLQKFDDEIVVSLSNIKDPVSVNFYSQVTPNEIPPRLQKMLSAVERSGGKVNISMPEGEPQFKDPTLVFSLFSGMYSGIKAFISMRADMNLEESVKNRDANILLARNLQGNLYIQKIELKTKDKK
jgi:hypothetical protein